ELTFNVAQTYPELTDFEGSSCIENKKITQVKVNIKPSIVREVVMVFRTRIDASDTIIAYETSSGIKPFEGSLYQWPSKDVTFYCSEFYFVDSVLIYGHGVVDLCSVFVKKGRNMAVKAAVDRQGTGIKLTRDWAMTDGDRSLDDENCTSVSVTSTDSVVFISFDFPVVVDIIVLSMGSGTGDVLSHYLLSTESENGTKIWHQETPAFLKGSKQFIHNPGTAEVSKISILFKNSMQTSSELRICELEAYGAKFWGSKAISAHPDIWKTSLLSGDGCSINCAGNGSCHENGSCINGCIDGYYGLGCINACGASCKGSQGCDKVTGHCIEGCLPGFWGKRCFEKCSSQCDGDKSCELNSGDCIHGYLCETCSGGGKCEKGSGVCKEGCKTSYWGAQCLKNCSVYCNKDRSCQIEKGDCMHGCKTGLWRKNCTKNCSAYCDGDGSCQIESGDCMYGCKTGFWGTNCTKRCSETCDGNRSCDKISGECNDGCISLYWGPQCLKKCSVFCDNDGTCDRNGTCTTGCRTGYSGSQCTKRGVLSVDGTWTCHCGEGNCSDSTNMCPTNQCITGWFAQSCQYRDAGVFAEMSHPALNDNNDSTCYESTNNTVTASWDKEFEISWVRLVFHSEANVSQFEILYDLHSQRKLCNSPTALKVPSLHNVYDLDCFVFVPARQISVTWYGQGRNMAQLTVPFVYENTQHISLPSLTDGDVDISNCHTFDTDENNVIYVDFRHQVSVNMITFYTVPSPTDAVIEVFLLKNYTTIERQITMSLVASKTTHQINFDAQTLSILQFRFLIGHASICEIELGGECHYSTYGLHCYGICRFTCFRNRCTYDGRCFDCVLGRSGPHCESDLLESYVDEAVTETDHVGVAKERKRVLTDIYLPYIIFMPISAGVSMLALLSCVRYFIHGKKRHECEAE
ncbi:hypothetical protein Btru_057162, partial [Bulinus truncatus]